MYIAARGGAGGRGNRFYLSNENRAPTVYEEGAKGEERTLLVELRIMAHAGLVCAHCWNLTVTFWFSDLGVRPPLSKNCVVMVVAQR